MGAERLADQRAVAVVVEVAARGADDPGAAGQLALAVAVVERREQLAQGEVASAAEDGEVAVGKSVASSVVGKVTAGQ